MQRKIKILRMINTIDPKFGGPAHAIIFSSLALLKQGFKIDILTCDQEGSNFFKSKKIRMINKGPSVGLFGFSLKFTFWLLKHRHEYDMFIVHGLWTYSSIIARVLLKKKYFVFTHGQLDPYFKNNFLKRIKKQIYWFLIEKSNLLNARSILLTSQGEKNTLEKTFVNMQGIKKKIIKYGIIKPILNKKIILKKFYLKFPNLKNKDFYLFLGRFHEKKGCDIIIDSVKKIKNFKKIILFAGPQSGSKYERKIKSLVKEENLERKILFSNALFGEIKWGAILASKAMLLASHGENFGVSLAESLCVGKPVLTTYKVNIYKEILESKAGFIAKNDATSFAMILKKFSRLNKNSLKKLSNNSLYCFKKNFDLLSKKNSLGNFLKNNFSKNANT